MELIESATAEKQSEDLASDALVVKETRWFRAWAGSTAFLVVASMMLVAAGWTTLAIGVAGILAIFTVCAVWYCKVIGSSWVLLVQHSQLLVKFANHPRYDSEALRLEFSDIKRISGVEVEVMWPWGGRRLTSRLIVDVDPRLWTEFDRLCCAIVNRHSAQLRSTWLLGFRLPNRFLISWEPTFTLTLPKFLSSDAIAKLETVTEIQRQVIDLRGFSALPQPDLDDKLRQMAEIGYLPMCRQLLRLEKKMSTQEASDYMRRLFPGYDLG